MAQSEPTIVFTETQGASKLTVNLALLFSCGFIAYHFIWDPSIGLSLIFGVPAFFIYLIVVVSYMETRLTTEELQIWQRWGIRMRTFPLTELSSVELVKVPFYMQNTMGWHYSLWKGGMFYRVWTDDCLLFRLKNGKKFYLGTEKPQEFIAILTTPLIMPITDQN